MVSSRKGRKKLKNLNQASVSITKLRGCFVADDPQLRLDQRRKKCKVLMDEPLC